MQSATKGERLAHKSQIDFARIFEHPCWILKK